jgi:outer membrane protein assembly factor BamB
MQKSDVFKLVIGDGWRASCPAAGHASTSGDALDFGRLRDVVDIVINGQSIIGRTDEDSVFFLVRDMLLAVERLLSASGTARISYYEGPWELVLQRLGNRAFITFYRGGQRPEILVKDKQVPFRDLVRGVVESARKLIGQVEAVEPSGLKDPLIVSIGQLISSLSSRLEEPRPASEPAPSPVKVESSRWAGPRTPESFSFGFRFLATGTDLLAPGKPQGSDLHPLLVRGQHVVHARGRKVALGEGYLFLQTERLLTSLRQLLSAWEEGRPMSSRLISDGLVVGIRLGRDDALVVSLMDSGDPNAIVVLGDLKPWDYADAVLGVAREVRRKIVETAPAQRRNLRLEALSREVKALSAWSKEQRRGAIINEDTERYRRLAEPRRSLETPMSIREASRLRFTERWRLEVEGLDLRGTVLCDDLALVAARSLLLGVETDSGAVVWRRDTDRADARIARAGRDGLVRATPAGMVEMLDLFTGVARWRTTLSPRSGGPPVLLVIEQGPAPGIVVVAEEDRKLVALDVRTGEPRWRFAAARGGQFALLRYGRLLYVASSDSHFNAIDIEDGTVVWRFADRTQFIVPPAAHGDTLLVSGGRPGRPEGRLYGLDAFSGKPRFGLPLSGGAMTAAIVADDVALVPVRNGRRNELVTIKVENGQELWRRDCTGWADPCSLMALDKCFVVNSAGGVLRSLHAGTGEERWTTVLGPTCSDDIPMSLKVVLRGGVLFAPADTVYVVRPEDGYVIHSLGGEPPVPDLLHIDHSCSVFIAEDSGHVGMFGLTNRLSVVS